MSKRVLLVLLTLSVFVPTVFSSDDKNTIDTHHYWKYQGKASDHIVNEIFDADLGSSFVFSLDKSRFRKSLDLGLRKASSDEIAYFPDTEGKMIRFRVREKSNFSSALATKFPDIRAYRGYSLDYPQMKVYFSYSGSGLEATVVDTATRAKTIIKSIPGAPDSYIVYSRLSATKPREPLACSTPQSSRSSFKTSKPAKSLVELTEKTSPLVRFSDESTLTTYRLAVAVNGQYTEFHGGTVESALAAINTTLTELNFIFETDLGMRLELIDDNDLIVYTDSETDPFQDDPSNLNGTMNGELQVVLDSVIGSENYDVGHIFSGIGGGGNAGAIGAFCDDDVKGSAWSASSQPEGSEFINLVAHEMGHQLGANHTFSMRTEGTGVNVEPASGTTIMSYAGTGEDNVAFFADNYYHNVSILQGLDYLKAQSCHVNEDIDNTVPTVAPLMDYTIPVGTPFVLTGSATDVDEDDILTYTWEQVDNGLVPSSVFGPENTQGANFRSMPPSENPTRYFPLITSVVSGELTLSSPYVGSTWETLSSVPREFNFAFTARDNALGGGGVASARTKITVVDSGGAFSVTSQDNGQLYLAASEQTITWALAGTDAAPILTDLVNIRLSVDGGLTYPYTLAENINNDGSHTVDLPDVVTSTARVRVDAVDNVFYAINARDFGITRDDIVLTYDELDYAVCNNKSTTASLIYETSSSFTDTAIFSTLNAPSGMSVGFSPLAASDNNTAIEITFSATDDIVPDTYPVEVFATSDLRAQSVTFNISTYSSIFAPVVLALPTNESVLRGLTAKLEWQQQNNAASYLVEVATDDSFNEIFLSSFEDSSSTSVAGLKRETRYYWRVTPVNSCGLADASVAFSFTTPNLFQAENLPVTIRSDEPTSVSSILSISENLVITDVNVGVDVSHTYVAELIVTLESPSGSVVTLLSQDTCLNPDYSSGSDINVVFDDDGSDLVCASSSPVVSGLIRPQLGNLDTFNNQSTQGDWVLTVTDIYSGDGGSLDNFTLEITTDGTYINKAPIALAQTVEGSPQNSIEVSLGAVDPENQTLTFSLVDAPDRGQLSVLDPSLLGSASTDGGARNVAINGGYAYVVDFDSGLAIIDISDPTNPGVLTYLDTTGEALGVSVRGNYAYVADGTSGLHIIDISDANSPSLIGTFDTDGYASDVELSSDGTKAYVSDGTSGLQIVDITNPATPSLWGSLDTGGEAFGVALSSDGIKAYVANGSSGLAIANVSDASDLYVYGSLNTAGSVQDVVLSVDEDTVYLASGSAGLQVVDVSYSFEPIFLGARNTNGSAFGLSLSADGSKVYIANGESGVQIIDIASPSSPTLGNFSLSPGLESNTLNVVLATDGAKVYAADSVNGLQIISIEPTTFSARDTIPQTVIYTHTSQDVVTDAPTDNFTFKVSDGALDSNVASVDIWMDTSITDDGIWTYVRTSDGRLTLTGCVNDCDTNLVIPEIIGFFSSPVVAIGEGAFARKGITSVTVPGSVTSIGDYAFTSNSLRSITISDSVTEIGEGAFSYNNLIATSFLGDRPSLGSESFFGNRNLELISYCQGKSGWPGASISVGSASVSPIEDCDAVNQNSAAFNKLLVAADSGDASELSTADLNAIIGLININADNLLAYQTAISLLASGSNIDQLNEVQSLIDSVNAGILTCSLTSYFVSVTSGSYPEEVSWQLEDAAGTVLYEGLAPFSGMMCLDDARYALKMSDSYGDGWNGTDFLLLTTAGEIVVTQTLNSGGQGQGAVNVGDYPNVKPSALAQQITLVEKIPTDITLSGIDPENDKLTYYLASEPTKGNFSVAFNPSLLGSVANNSIGVDVVISQDGARAYLADFEAGLQIIDTSDVLNPTILSTLDTSGLAYNLSLSPDGNTVYIADEEEGLQIIDVSDSSNPSLLSTFDTEGFSLGVTLSDDGLIAYVADVNSLEIIDVSDTQSPSLLGSIETSGAAYGTALSSDESMAYVAVSEFGLDIIDISNPAYPVLVSTLDTPGGAFAVKLSSDDTTAYISDDSFGLQIADITDSTNPTILSSFDTEGDSWGLALSSDGRYAYIADLTSLQVIDVSDKLQPKSKGSFSTDDSRGVALSSDDNIAYIAETSGLAIIDSSISSIQVGDQLPKMVTYTSLVPDATSDTFSFKVNDGRLDSENAIVDITILLDTDGDGVPNDTDAFPLDPAETIDTDSDGVGDNADADDDGDGVSDDLDMFPLDPSESLDTDLDGIGNNADEDDDNDGVVDEEDALPLDPTEYVDTDLDGIGNNADTDDDGDGVSDSDDALPLDPTNDSDGDGVANNLDRFPLDSTETMDSDSDGVGDNSDVYPNNGEYAYDTDGDGMPDAWESQYGLDLNDPSDASSDQDNDGVVALDEFLNGTVPSGSIDLDGNGQYDALTDGLLLLRGMFGLNGDALITGTLASDALYTSSEDIETRIELLNNLADVDGNGQIDALTDGLLVLRYLFGLQGEALISDVIAADATRTSSAEIEAHLASLTPSI
jgi:subtilisin-like proprotein convertase family protein